MDLSWNKKYKVSTRPTAPSAAESDFTDNSSQRVLFMGLCGGETAISVCVITTGIEIKGCIYSKKI